MISLSIIIDTGSVDEEEDSSGVAHFLEHMHFKGTKKRSLDQLDNEIESKGGSLDAFTTRDNTMFSMNIYKDDLEWGIELLSDIFLDSIYREDLVQCEKSTIYSELLDCQKDDYTTNLEISHHTSFQGYSTGRPILGLKQDILNMNREKIARFHENNYFGGNFTLLGVGNLDHEEFVSFSDKYFGRAPAETPQHNKQHYQNKMRTTWRTSENESAKLVDFSSEKPDFSGIKGRSDKLKNTPDFDMLGRHSGLGVFEKPEILSIDSAFKSRTGFIGVEERPVFKPNMTLIEGNELYSTKIGIYYEAPTWFDPEMYTFLILQRMIGNVCIS